MRVSGKRLSAASLAGFLWLPLVGGAEAQVNVTTYHYDNLRTGWNQAETTLTQSNVGGGSFGLLATNASLDGQIDAQPLIVANETINGSQHNVVYVVTENNTVYALDASSGEVLLHRGLGKPVNTENFFYCNVDGNTVGIDSTPVIDPSSGLLYVIAYDWEKNAAVYRLHELSPTTLKDAVAPVMISASGTLTNGGTYQFDATASRQRPALLLSNNTVYAGFGSWCDADANESRGWVLGWQTGTLAPLASNKLSNTRAASKNNYFLTAVWMSGYGLAASTSGSVYFVTGNSDYSGKSYNKVTNISESAAEMSADLSTMESLFTPGDHASLDEDDGDFGAGGLMLLPPQQGDYPDLAAAAGKDGNLHLLDADQLKTKFGSYQINGCWCGPSYFEGSDGAGRIVTSGGTTLGVWKLETKKKPMLRMEYQWNGIANGQSPGFFTSVSSNGTNSGSAVIWAVGRPTSNDDPTVDLYAINADTGKLLFSGAAGQWPNTSGNANIVPVVANGLVYVASDQMLTIFGPGGARQAKLPKIAAAAPLPLAPGHHEIFGTVERMNGSTITIIKRDGTPLLLDVSGAMQNFRYAAAEVGHALVARGTYDKSGVFHADVAFHAKDHPTLWPADR
ncbi:MAG TPA: hypothetical protein VMF67_01315 [Rhizomicrobium sp.]|nr:hypothetical protein [Rhizomicrobium sp.]